MVRCFYSIITVDGECATENARVCGYKLYKKG